MDSSPIPTCLLPMVFLCFGPILAAVNPTSNYNNLVFKHCSNQTSTHSTFSLSSTLSSLFEELVSQSSQSKFYETNSGDDKAAISGLFQCRGDLSEKECYNCVNKIPSLSNTLCGETIPARIQLSGCYMHYEEDGYNGISRLELLHQTCSEHKAVYSGFKEMRKAAFEAVLSCVVSNGNGFCDMRYGEIHVMAQCEGQLEGCECGECVSSAMEVAEDECGDSVSGQFYVGSCFLSYSYYSGGTTGNSYREKGTGSSSGKLVAIVVGGVAALSLGLVFWYFIKSGGKKRDDW